MGQVISSLFTVVILGLVMFLGGLLAWATMQPIIDYTRSLSWPQTEGEILRSGVVVVEGDDSISYHPSADYRYVVNGEPYRGDRLFFGSQWNGPVERPAQRIVDRYPEGQPITVFYDPANPSESVVERRLGTGVIVVFPIMVLVVAATIGAPLVMMAASVWRFIRARLPARRRNTNTPA